MSTSAQRRHLRLRPAAAEAVHPQLERIRAELEVPGPFTGAALAEAHAAARTPVVHPEDLTDVPFLTIDPPGARDLDQAMHISRTPDGFLVRYAIADPASFVVPGGALDGELAERGVTFYGPDGSIALHPKEISEGAASLLAGESRPACVWSIGLDAEGGIVEATVRRAQVRSRAQLTYEDAAGRLAAITGAGALEDGAGEPGDGTLALLGEVGPLRIAQERARGGASLAIAEQEVEPDDGGYRLVQRRTLAVEDWNAQISLLTGIAAADLMRKARVGVLRTLEPAHPRDIARVRRAAHGLGIDWPEGVEYGEVLAGLDSADPAHAAFLQEATSLFRGAGYLTFDGELPPQSPHAAIASEYAHVTAPLRRLVDRYGLEICLAASAGTEVPGWVRAALPDLPAIMGRAGQRSSAYERACVNLIEAVLLRGREGQEFDGVIVDVEDDPGEDHGEGGARAQRGTVVIADPAVRASVTGTDLPLGEHVRVRLEHADVDDRRVAFALV
ncbi:RNB domain-containing ribonuclease [Ruania halotolerans]|uniref:RNB domain-containing ribonuclease n=1 Tax=Ruania halotolerans TaxID=2897773 RepID=UPI001E314272|nr:RNB domain-containing ribonuclease [Ruania halotolerans]UFU05991.1 RNB domain-containing ribonuclease [Ruania halotolerans]